MQLISLALSILHCLASISLFTKQAEGLSIPINERIKIRPAPLIGGPSWLLLHCQVIVDSKIAFDFVPLNATEPATLQKLAALQSVPALARARTIDGFDDADQYLLQAANFCRNYDKELHLVSNNCWTFAFELIRYIMNGDEANMI